MKNKFVAPNAKDARSNNTNISSKKKTSGLAKDVSEQALVRLHLSPKAPEGLTLASVGVGTAPKF